MDFKEQIKGRKITEIVHFTSNHGLVGTLEMRFLLSRRNLPDVNHLAHLVAPTSEKRQEAAQYFDKAEDWLDFVNLSVSEINSRYFNVASKKWHTNGDRWWTILSFSPEILMHPGVFFTTTNNVYQFVKREHGGTGFNALFGEKIARKGDWYAFRGCRADNLATCEQAEILYPNRLSIEYLRRIYVATDEQHDIVAGWLGLFEIGGIEVVIQPEKFRGVPN